MKLTNKHKLPQPVYDAVSYNDYTGGKSDYSVSGLADPAQKKWLTGVHKHEIEEDASERLYALMGSAMHKVLERADTTGITEKRLQVTVEGKQISGQFDRLGLVSEDGGITGILQDYKLASVWEYIYGLKPDKITQANCYVYLLRENGYKVDKAQIVMFFRDWMKSKAKVDKSYPQIQMGIIDVPIWTQVETYKYISERIAIHEEARRTGAPAPCSDEERWYTGDTFAVMKGKNKKATRVFDNRNDANEYRKKIVKDADIHYVVKRPGVNKRCDDYCITAPFCEQYKAIKEVS